MDDDSISGSNVGKEDAPNSDARIPKMNMKYDGTTWLNKNNEKKVYKDDIGCSVQLENQMNKQDQSSSTSDESNGDSNREFEDAGGSLSGEYDEEEETPDDEEADEDEEGAANELNDLAKESKMPLDKLVALYCSKKDTAIPSAENQKSSSNEDEGDAKNEDNNEESDESDGLVRQLRSTSAFLSPSRVDHGDDENDRNYVPPPVVDDWKKAVRVGEEYQADIIPERNQQSPDYDDSTDQLVWDPIKLTEEQVKSYLTSVGGKPLRDGRSSLHLPSGSHLRDNEDALLLLNQCNDNVDQAVKRYKSTPPVLSNELPVWSEEECRQFEHGLSIYGKDFHAIHQNNVSTRSIGEMVKFYYIWKKSARFDCFSAKTRLGKKKDPLHPGISDYMERLLDETEHATSLDHSNHLNPSSSGLPTMSHSAALQQHLIDLRVTRKQNRLNNAVDSESSVNECTAEMNGFLGGDDSLEDIGMFSNIPAHHIYPPIPFASMAPTSANSNPAQVAPVSSAVTRPQGGAPANLNITNCNNNSRIGTVLPDESDLYKSKQFFKPVEPAKTRPRLDCQTNLPPSVHQSGNVYSRSASSVSVQQQPLKETNQFSSAIEDVSEHAETSALNLKHFLPSEIHDSLRSDTKRRRKNEIFPGSVQDTASSFCTLPHVGTSVPSRNVTAANISRSTNRYVSTPNEFPRDGISETTKTVGS